MLHGFLDIWQRVEGKELAGLGQFSTATVKIHFKIHLLALLLLLVCLTEVLIVVRVINVDHEVDAQIELQFLGNEVPA